MKVQKNSGNIDIPSSDTGLPEMSLIIIRNNGKINIVNLDNFSNDMHKGYYIDAVEKYGKDNVRYCRVLGAKVKVDVEFDE